MTTVMTVAASYLSMGAWILLNLLFLRSVAAATVFFQRSHVHQSGNRGVGIAVATQAIFETGAVNLTMTGLTVWHNVLPFGVRTEGVEAFMAEAAFQLMFAAGVTDGVKYRFVAAGTVHRCELNNCLGIGIVCFLGF